MRYGVRAAAGIERLPCADAHWFRPRAEELWRHVPLDPSGFGWPITARRCFADAGPFIAAPAWKRHMQDQRTELRRVLRGGVVRICGEAEMISTQRRGDAEFSEKLRA